MEAQIAIGFAVLVLLAAGTALVPAASPQEAPVYPVIVLPALSVADRTIAPAPGGSHGLDGSVLQVKQ